MKKTVYIIAFTFLGILVQFLVHAAVEIWYIGLLIDNFPKYSFGISWNDWLTIHHIGTTILLLIGTVLGFWQGKFWWHKIYEEGFRRAGL